MSQEEEMVDELIETIKFQVLKIDEQYEYYQYDSTKIVHDFKNDLFNVNSIIESVQSDKTVEDWLVKTDELREAITQDMEKDFQEILMITGPFPGYYVTKAFVPVIANWANPIHAIHVIYLLHEIDEIKISIQGFQLLCRTEEVKKWKTKFNSQREYFYLIFFSDQQEQKGYTLLESRRALTTMHIEERYAHLFPKQFFQVWGIEDPKMLHRKIRIQAPKFFKIKKNKDDQNDFDIEFFDLNIRVKTEKLDLFKDFLKEFFKSEMYEDDIYNHF